jgi:hypothetical protein
LSGYARYLNHAKAKANVATFKAQVWLSVSVSVSVVCVCVCLCGMWCHARLL